MKSTRRLFSIGRAFTVMFAAAAAAPAVIAFTAATAFAEGPDFSIGAEQYPLDDAIILRWEQHWAVRSDGTVSRRDHKWIKLLNHRPIRGYADPRIDFSDATDEVIVHKAVTHLPDGQILPVPGYSLNIAAPSDVAGWPEYADWRQEIVCFSGIVDDCVLEMDYEVISKPGATPWINADLRLNEDYPTVERMVTVTVPNSMKVAYELSGLPGASALDESTDGGGHAPYAWRFTNLDGALGEPQSLSWEKRCGRLAFTTCPSLSTWVGTMIHAVDRAAQPDDRIAEFAKDVVGSEADPKVQAKLIAKKLGATFNYVNSYKTMTDYRCRSASEVFQANYGSPLESAAVLIAALRSLGTEVYAQVAVDTESFNHRAPTQSAFAAVVAVFDTPDGAAFVHPRSGLFTNPGTWGNHTLLALNNRGDVEKTCIAQRGEDESSSINIAGRVELKDDGAAEADLRFRLTGVFYNPAGLDTAGLQKSLVKSTAGRVLSGFTISSHAVTALSDTELKATAKLKSSDKLPEIEGRRLLTLSEGPAFLSKIPMPLNRSTRRTDVKLAGAFWEHVDITIALPVDWSPQVLPDSMAQVAGDWGRIVQTVTRNGDEIHVVRDIEITRDVLSPDEFAVIRDGVNSLKAAGSLHLLAGK